MASLPPLKEAPSMAKNEYLGIACCGHTSYLSPPSPTCRWRRNLPCGEISDFNTWNFSTWRGISVFPHNRCGEMWIFAKFGEISHFSTGQMWRNLKFIQFFVIKSVLRCFCEIHFGAIYALLRGENFCKKLGRWRKNDKYQVCHVFAYMRANFLWLFLILSVKVGTTGLTSKKFTVFPGTKKVGPICSDFIRGDPYKPHEPPEKVTFSDH